MFRLTPRSGSAPSAGGVRLRRVHLWAVEDTSVQVTFHASPGEVRLRALPVGAGAGSGAGTDRSPDHTVQHGGGPGGVVLDGLRPATAYRIELALGAAKAEIAANTLPSPPGAALARIATISDLHLGAHTHGLANTMFDRSGLADTAPLRCARGAVVAARQWNAELLVGKGDLTQHGWAEEWRQLGDLLDRHAGAMARLGVPGNHDKPSVRELAASAGLAHAGLSNRAIEVCDLDGIRVIAFDSAADAASVGTLHDHAAAVADAAADAARAGRAALVCLHHPLERAPIQLQYPKGVPWAESRRFARLLQRANRHTLITAGHTHRNRMRRVAGLVHTEVGSTKDWPGVWGGYVVHEGGIRQVVPRITAADAIGWIDYTRWAAGGLWWPYSPGRMTDRCFTLRWDR